MVVEPESAPLDIDKTAAPDVVVDPGDTVSYTIMVTNTSAQTQTDIRVTDNLPAGVTYVGGSLTLTAPVDVPENFLDRFDLRSYARNDGSQNWTGSWIEGGESDGPTAGAVQVLFDSVRGSTFSLRMAGPNRSLTREADLSAYANATLQFDYRRQGLAAGEYFAVEVSSNGVSGTWFELDRFEGAATDSAYTSVEHDITAWIATNTAIRFANTLDSMDVSDIVWFDDVHIVSSVRTAKTTAGGSPPTWAGGIELWPGETITIMFDATVD